MRGGLGDGATGKQKRQRLESGVCLACSHAHTETKEGFVIRIRREKQRSSLANGAAVAADDDPRAKSKQAGVGRVCHLRRAATTL